MEVNLQNETKQIVGVKEEITFDAEAELHPLEYVDMALNFKFEIRDKYDPDHVYDLPSFRDEHEASFEFSDHLEDHIKQELEDYKSDELTTEPTYCSTPVAKGIKMVLVEDPLFSRSYDGKLDSLTVDQHPTVLDGSRIRERQENTRSRSPLNNGFCRPHGGTRPYTRCKAEGCSKCAWKGGFCTSHGGIRTRAVCRTDGCAKFSQKGGYCCSHGEVSYRCTEKDCPKYALKGGHCKAHGGTSVRSGCKARACPKRTVKGGYCWSHGGTRPHAKCVQRGCLKFSQKDGLCKAHWSSRPRECIADECESNARRAGWSDALVG